MDREWAGAAGYFIVDVDVPKHQPVRFNASMDASGFAVEVETEVLYSSTCPCSAALARQLIQEQFDADFPEGQALDRHQVIAWLGSEAGAGQPFSPERTKPSGG